MRQADIRRAVEIGDGARHAQDAVIAARREAKAGGDAGDERAAFRIGGGDVIENRAFGIGVETHMGVVCKARGLHRAGGSDAAGHLSRRVARSRQVEIGEGDGRHLDAQIEAIHQGAGDAANVIFTAIGRAGTGAVGVAEIPAFAGIGGGD